MSAKKYTSGEATQMVMDSDYDPGPDSHESHNETDISDISDTDHLDRAVDTEYMDKVIKTDGTVRVKACRRVHGKHESDSSFDHSSEFEKDETSLTTPQSLQELRGKKKDTQLESACTCFHQCECRETRCRPLSGANQHPEQSW